VRKFFCAFVAIAACAILPCDAQTLRRVLGAAGAEPNALMRDPSVAPGGATIVFTTTANNLGTTAGAALNVYAVDLDGGVIRLVSRNPTTGAIGDGNAFLPVASRDGRYVAFESLAGNLGPSAAGLQILRVDRTTGAVTRASESASGTAGNDQSRFPAISGDGRYVAFQSFANALVAGDNNDRADIFVKDFNTGALEVISRNAAGAFADDNAAALTTQAISSDARHVVFASAASNMVAGVAGGVQQAYLRDRTNGTTTLVSRSGTGAAGTSPSDQVAISPDGRYIAFRSFAPNLVDGATSRVFRLDRTTGTLVAVPRPTATACRAPKIADTGDVVMLCDMASPTPAQAFRWPADGGAPVLVSRSAQNAATPGNGVSGGGIGISANAATIAFESQAANLVTGDTNGVADVFWSGNPTNDRIFFDDFE
jgi:Tol biopolymer transport system component